MSMPQIVGEVNIPQPKTRKSGGKRGAGAWTFNCDGSKTRWAIDTLSQVERLEPGRALAIQFSDRQEMFRAQVHLLVQAQTSPVKIKTRSTVDHRLIVWPTVVML